MKAEEAQEWFENLDGPILFWTCPRGCRGHVQWDTKVKPEKATCMECGETNHRPEQGGKEPT